MSKKRKAHTKKARKANELFEEFGPHLMVDVYECNHHILNDPHALHEFMNKMVELLGMNMLTAPYIIKAEPNTSKDPGGWTGTVIIAESHISFHTFVKRKFVTIDLYSCKEFDTEKAVDFIKSFFQSDDVDVYMQKRGVRYPKKDLV